MLWASRAMNDISGTSITGRLAAINLPVLLPLAVDVPVAVAVAVAVPPPVLVKSDVDVALLVAVLVAVEEPVLHAQCMRSRVDGHCWQ